MTPLRFRPIFKPALWGGTDLRPMFGADPSAEPTGEAWVLADVGSDSSVVADGPFAGATLRELVGDFADRLLGPDPATGGRFPLLLKFIQARQPLSVQVHPTDDLAKRLEGPAAVGKTEAWVILNADPGAELYAGLIDGTTLDNFRDAIVRGGVDRMLQTHRPAVGDCYFLPAGTVHAIGGGLTLFEIQQPSDLTYRLYDWNRLDPKTGRPRDLHIEKGLASVDWGRGPVRATRDPVVECPYFRLSHRQTDRPARVGEAGRCHVIVGLTGRAELRHAGVGYPVGPGAVWLVPAEVGACEIVPAGPVSFLECGLGSDGRWSST